MKKEKGFSFWFGPRYLVELEKEQNPDGLHFQKPGTIGKVNMVNLLLNKIDLDVSV